MDALTHGKEHHRRRAHRISLGVPNTIFYWLPLYRGTQSSIFSLPLSLSSCNIYLAFSLSPSTLSSEGFSVRRSVSAFIDTLQNCTGVRSPIRLHFITVLHFTVHTLSVRTSVAPAATACRVECRPDSNRVHYL